MCAVGVSPQGSLQGARARLTSRGWGRSGDQASLGARNRPALGIRVESAFAPTANRALCTLPHLKLTSPGGPACPRGRRRTDSGRLSALNTRACTRTQGQPAATCRPFRCPSHRPGRVQGSILRTGAGGAPWAQSPSPPGWLPESLTECRAASSRERGCWWRPLLQISVQTPEKPHLAGPSVCGRRCQERRPHAPHPIHAVPGLRLAAGTGPPSAEPSLR